ncbi:MAG TPA: TAXI family TRAP transporter solute-binding subunit [Vicinamibacterales bacterium]|nr:TAXI family TRAP transporter solute-binding subunit [Vicinamibacterales bacterium]
MKRQRTALVLLTLFTLACTPPSVRFLSLATGGTGGVYYPYGGALAQLITDNIPGVQATAEVTGASVDNLKLLQLGRVDLAFVLADTLAEAVRGTGPFQEAGAVGSARTLAVLYTNYTHVVVRAGSGIGRVADLDGKVVSVGSPGSGTELVANRVLAAAGLDPRQGIVRHALGVTESAGALKDGKLDAFFWSGGVPTPALQDLAATPGFGIALLHQDDLLPLLQRDFGASLYRPAVIPSGTYRGIDRDTGVAGVINVLVAASSLDDETAYAIVKLMFERKASLEAAHPEARHLAPPAGDDVSPAPFHPGASRYYKELGG